MVAAQRALAKTRWRLWCPRIDSSRVHSILNGPAQPLHRQGQHDLYRHILAPAKGAADGRVDDAYVLLGDVEGVSDLRLILMRPLAADHHRDPSLVIDVAQAGLGLQIGVFLARDLVSRLDDHIGVIESGVHVASTYLVPRTNVAVEDKLRVDVDAGIGGV